MVCGCRSSYHVRPPKQSCVCLYSPPALDSVASSPNGWTDDYLCTEWFKKCFIPQAEARRETDAPILLIVDGHGSHGTAEMRQLAIENNVHIFCLPPHTTHRLQPLDVGIFGPLQHAWTKRCNEYYVSSRGEEIERGQLIREYMAVRNGVFEESLVKKAWYSSGITSGTWSASFFPPSAFATSYATSTVTHVPPSYPTSGDMNTLPPDAPPPFPITLSTTTEEDDDLRSLFGSSSYSSSAPLDSDSDSDSETDLVNMDIDSSHGTLSLGDTSVQPVPPSNTVSECPSKSNRVTRPTCIYAIIQ